MKNNCFIPENLKAFGKDVMVLWLKRIGLYPV